MTGEHSEVKITKEKLIKLLNRFIEESTNSDEDIAFRYELVERLTDNRGGQVTGYSETGEPIVSLPEGSDWLKILNEPAQMNIEISDWELMGGAENIPENRQQPFRLQITTADDGVYFDMYPAICDEWEATVPEALSSQFGFHGKIEVSQGVPSLSLGRSDQETALFIKTGNAAGLTVEPETGTRIGHELKRNPHFSEDISGHRKCIFVDDGYEFDIRMVEDHALAITHFLVKHPQTPDIQSRDISLLHQDILEKLANHIDTAGRLGHYSLTIDDGDLAGFNVQAEMHDNLPVLKSMSIIPPAPAGKPTRRKPR